MDDDFMVTVANVFHGYYCKRVLYPVVCFRFVKPRLLKEGTMGFQISVINSGISIDLVNSKCTSGIWITKLYCLFFFFFLEREKTKEESCPGYYILRSYQGLLDNTR